MTDQDPEQTAGEKHLLEALEAGDLAIGDFMNACAIVVRLGAEQAVAMQHLRVTRETQRMVKRWRQFFHAWNDLMTTCRQVAEKRAVQGSVDN